MVWHTVISLQYPGIRRGWVANGDDIPACIASAEKDFDAQWRSEGGAGGAGRKRAKFKKNHGKIQIERRHRASTRRKRGITVPSPPD